MGDVIALRPAGVTRRPSAEEIRRALIVFEHPPLTDEQIRAARNEGWGRYHLRGIGLRGTGLWLTFVTRGLTYPSSGDLRNAFEMLTQAFRKQGRGV